MEQLTRNKLEAVWPRILALGALLKHAHPGSSRCRTAAVVRSKSIKDLNVSEVM